MHEVNLIERWDHYAVNFKLDNQCQLCGSNVPVPHRVSPAQLALHGRAAPDDNNDVGLLVQRSTTNVHRWNSETRTSCTPISIRNNRH